MMDASVALDHLLRHLPAPRRELLRKVIDTETYLSPNVVSMPVNELLEWMEEPPEFFEPEEDCLSLYH